MVCTQNGDYMKVSIQNISLLDSWNTGTQTYTLSRENTGRNFSGDSDWPKRIHLKILTLASLLS